MELEYLLKAAGRYWWLVAICTALGFAPAIALSAGPIETFQAEALVSVAPPSGSSLTADDRYIATQLVALQSTTLAELAAIEAGPAFDAKRVSDAMRFSAVDDTNIIRLISTGSNADEADLIGRSYIAAFANYLRTQGTDATAPNRQALEVAIAQVEQELDQLNRQVSDVLESYLGSQQTPTADLPTIDQLDPTLSTARESALTQYSRLLQEKADLEFNQSALASSQVIQPPVPSPVPGNSNGLLLFVVAPIFGFLVGVTLAAAVARRSNLVLDLAEAERILGGRFLGSLGRSKRLADGPDSVMSDVARNPPAVISAVCVAAEADAALGRPFTVLVTGPKPASGVSTMALAIATRFASLGSRVLLVDADTRNPFLSRALVSAESNSDHLGGSSHPSSKSPRIDFSDTVRTLRPDLLFVGVDGDPASGLLELLNSGESGAGLGLDVRVVVIDGGPLMAAASTLRLSRSVDSVVLAVPVAKQSVHELEMMAEQLASSQAVFPVATPRLRRRR